MATVGNQMTLKKRRQGYSGVLRDCSGLGESIIGRLEKPISFSDLKWPNCEKLTFSVTAMPAITQSVKNDNLCISSWVGLTV